MSTPANRLRPTTLWISAVLVVAVCAADAWAQRLDARLDGTAVQIDVDGKPFTRYTFAADQKYPYFWPVNGPASGQSLTTETSEPYPHHHSLFFGCDRVNGFNFWQEANARGQIVSDGPVIASAGPDRVEFTDRCLWQAPDQPPVIEDTRRIVVTAPSPQLRFIDFHITLRALVDVHVKQTNHSLFAMRVMPHLSIKGGGTMTASGGRTGVEAIHGRKGAWCDYSGDNHGHIEGLTILDHPENAWFPCEWFVRDYGFVSPTPLNFIGEAGWSLLKGETFALKYRVVAHAGTTEQVDLDAQYRQWAGAEKMRIVPVAMAFAGTPVNGGQSLVSDGQRQFIAFYDPDRDLTVGTRKLGTAAWQFVRLDERVGWDSHNRIAMAIDRKGYLHLTANHHNNDLNYFRTAKPGDIESFGRIDRFGDAREKSVCYPQFFRITPDNELAIMYRFGKSGEGERFMLKYAEDTKTWSPIGPGSVLSGRPRFNAYPFGMRFDRKGRLHLAWCWRETPDVATNQDICYAVSPDGGVTWQRSDGQPLETPIRPETAEVVDPVPQGGGLLNGGSLTLDRHDRPWISYIKYGPNGGTQMYVTTRTDAGWKTVQLSNWTYQWELSGGGSIPSVGISLPRLSFGANDTVDVQFAHKQYYWGPQVFRTTVDALLTMKPGAFKSEPQVTPLRRAGLDYRIAVGNAGTLQKGEQHWMIQQTADSNRDKEPEAKHPPTMIYVVEAAK